MTSSAEVDRVTMPSIVRHVVVMGVSGAGKTTLAETLALRLGWPLAEADDFHPAANIDKMAAGIPLDDGDRWPWLARIREWMNGHAAEGHSTVLTCSALKLAYREILAAAEGDVRFVHLDAASDLLRRRLDAREGHFMPSSLLSSQLEILEPLTADELSAGSLALDASLPPERIVAEVQQSMRLPSAPAPPRA